MYMKGQCYGWDWPVWDDHQLTCREKIKWLHFSIAFEIPMTPLSLSPIFRFLSWAYSVA